MSIKISKSDLNNAQLFKLKDDCYVIGNETDYGPPQTVECWMETPNSIYVPFYHAREIKLGLRPSQWEPHNTISFTGKFKNDNQKQVFEEAVKYIDSQGSITLALHCGFGKTFEGIKLACYYKLKTAVLVHRTVLSDQWVESIQKFSTATTQVVDTNGLLDPNADFYIFNIAYVPKVWDRNSKKWVKRVIGSFKNIGFLIVDEAHIACASEMAKALSYFQPKYCVALTATPRTDGLDQVLELHFGKEKIIRKADSEFKVYRLPTFLKPEFTLNKMGKKDWNSVINSLVNDKKRNELIVKLTKKFQDFTILILTKRKDHCDLLFEMLKGESVTKMKGTDRTYDKTARILISTFSKLGVGFDDPRLKMFIIACDVGQIEQYAGRLRENGDGKERIIIDLVDDDYNCLAHWKERREWYISRNGKIFNYYSIYPNENPKKDTVEQPPKRLAKKQVTASAGASEQNPKRLAKKLN